MSTIRILILVILTYNLLGCATTAAPDQEYILARAAIEAASSADAARYSPGVWHQAQESFRKAKLLFQEREYDLASKEFIKARLAAEKAENTARLMRVKSGEVL